MNRKYFLWPITFVLGMLLTSDLIAFEDDAYANFNYTEYDTSEPSYELAPLSSNLMGDKLDLKTGQTVFEVVDVSIPGNNALPVEIRRKFIPMINDLTYTEFLAIGFADWQLDLPVVSMLALGDQSEYIDNSYQLLMNRSRQATYRFSRSRRRLVGYVSSTTGGETEVSPVYTDDWANTADQVIEPGLAGRGGWGGGVTEADAFEVQGARSVRDGEACSGTRTGNSITPFLSNSVDSSLGGTLSIPGKTSADLIRNNGGIPGAPSIDYPLITEDKWKIACIPQQNGEREGFLAISPEGVKYYLDREVLEPIQVFPSVELNVSSGGFFEVTPYGFMHQFVVTRIEDRFGNWVSYEYNDSNQLTEITSSDGRLLSITLKDYSGAFGFVDKITAGTGDDARTWIYKYDESGNGGFYDRTLKEVVRPDGKSWLYDTYQDYIEYDVDGMAGGEAPDLQGGCLEKYIDGDTSRAKLVQTFTHPDGIVGTFDLVYTTYGQSDSRGGTVGGPLNYESAIEDPRCQFALSLVKKTLSGPGYQEQVWSYDYSQNDGHYLSETTPRSGSLLSGALPSNVDSLHFSKTKITQPDGSYVNSFFNRQVDNFARGELFAQQWFSVDDALLQEVQYDYHEGVLLGSTHVYRHRNSDINDKKAALSRHTTIIKDGGIDTSYTQEFSSFNVYDQPQKLHEYNSFSSDERFHSFGYLNDTVNWLLGLKTQSLVSETGESGTYTTVNHRTFHSASGAYKSLPNCHYSFGIQSYCNTSYWTANGDAGLPRRIDLNESNRWVEYSNYKRGIPQTIRKPQSLGSGVKYAYNEVDDNGWVTKYTDYDGNCTDYDYNGIGLLTLIDPCSAQWANTVIDYSTTLGPEGLNYVEAGMYKQTVTQGNYEKVTYHDSMLRPKLIRERDVTDAETERFVRNDFDYLNRPTYSSKPAATASTQYGVITTYDGLGRYKSMNDNTDNGQVDYTYLSGNRTRVNNNRGYETTTTFLSYGSPEQSSATYIAAPEGVNTSINYNVFGNPTSINQGGITEHRVYDIRQNLCKTVRPRRR